MRILIVSIYYKPEPVPKPHELAEGLAARGHEVTVLTGFPNYPSGRLYPGFAVRPWRTNVVNGVRVVRLPLYPDHSASALLRSAHYVTFFLSALALGPVLSGLIDVVYVWGNPPTSGLAGWIISRLRRARFVYGVHDLWPDLALAAGMIQSSLVARMIDALERFVLRKADLVLPISDGFRRRILEKGVPAERLYVIPHWADGALYRPVPRDPALAERLGLSSCFVVLYAGNVGRLQGLQNLIEAADLLRRTHASLRVVVMGDGVERPRLKGIVTERQINNVMFIDPEPPARVAVYSALADVLYVGLVSSTLSPLSVPSKVQTYLACGRPILSNVPGETAELVSRGCFGLNCESDTPQGIAEGIRRMAALSENERAVMGKKARQVFIEEFEMSSLLGRHEKLMEALLV
ncbi:MAG: glycosyltransferase family 4 protein [Chloroflexi bacterium]|nr:MAG: glycosyltransferase family 4 protein [Chloroflexota bacterium]